MIILQKFIYREDLENNRYITYVFGDNDQRIGKGGQAKEMRGESNSIGIRVKKAPGVERSCYYYDKEYNENIKKIDQDFTIVEKKLESGELVIFPSDGIGTGLAKLGTLAPRTLRYLESVIDRLKKI